MSVIQLLIIKLGRVDLVSFVSRLCSLAARDIRIVCVISNFVSERHLKKKEIMASPVVRKSNKEEENDLLNVDEVTREAKGLIDRILGDVGKSSATKQLIIGSISGW